MKLHSDFPDYYDDFFSNYGPLLIRRSDSGPRRRDMFQMLNSLGLKTPRYGEVGTVVNQLMRESFFSGDTLDSLQLIVYTDEFAQGGKGKIKIRASEAKRLYGSCFCSEFLESPKKQHPSSLRYLQLGNRRWWLRYVNLTQNPSEWRSNFGPDVEVRVIEEVKGLEYHPDIQEPMFSIDFIPTMPLLAVDFNLAPRLQGTGIDEVLAPGDAFRLLRDAHRYFNGYEQIEF